MKRETRNELADRAKRTGDENFALTMCLRASVTGTDWTCLASGRADNEAMAVYATGLARADGGFVMEVRCVDGQGAVVSASYALAWIARRRDYIPARLDAAATLAHRLTEAVVVASYKAQRSPDAPAMVARFPDGALMPNPDVQDRR